MKNKEKYDLKELKIKWLDHKSMEINADDGVYRLNSNSNAVLLRGLVNWLESEYKEPILDNEEREYLKAVISPWRDKVKSICKENFFKGEYQYIVIRFKTDEGGVCLPNFPEDSMYKGMEIGEKYSLEDLGL